MKQEMERLQNQLLQIQETTSPSNKANDNLSPVRQGVEIATKPSRPLTRNSSDHSVDTTRTSVAGDGNHAQMTLNLQQDAASLERTSDSSKIESKWIELNSTNIQLVVL